MGASAHSEAVDYVLEYQPQRSFLISAVYPTVLIGDTKSLGSERPASPIGSPKPSGNERRPPSQQFATPVVRHGKELRVKGTRYDYACEYPSRSLPTIPHAPCLP
jgi:hypothetical protein